MKCSTQTRYFVLPESPDIENPPETIQNENGRNPILVARWNRVIGARTFLEVKGGGIYIRDHFDPYSGDFTTPGHTDSGTGVASINTSSTITKQTQNQTSVSATLSHVLDHLIAGSHELKGGVQYSSGTNLSNAALAGGVSYSDFNGAPDRATFRETSATIGRVKTTGVFLQDNWTLVPRVTLNLGVRFDRSAGDIPETDKLDSTFAQKVGTYPGVSDVVTYDNWSPRLGTAIKLDDAGKTVVKTSYGRYYARLNTGLFTSIAPGGAVSNTYGYNAATRQYDIPQSTTNPKLTATIDPNLKNEYVDQFFVGVERELLPDLGVNASYIVKRERDFIRGRDFASTYVPRDVTETFDGVTHTLTVFNRTSAAGAVRLDRPIETTSARSTTASCCRPTSGCPGAGSCRGRISGRFRKDSARPPCRRRNRALARSAGSQPVDQRLRPFPDRQHPLVPRFEHGRAAVGSAVCDS